MSVPHRLILGPALCHGCAGRLVWISIGGLRSWRDERTLRPHECSGVREPQPIEGRCGAWMRNAKDYCARRPGHGFEHRSPYALGNARAAA